MKDPGTYKLCLWIQNQPTSSTAAAVGEVPLTVRANVATIAVLAPATAPEKNVLAFTVAGTTEVPRQVFVESKPAGAGPCAASALAENASFAIAGMLPANGMFALPIISHPLTFSEPGRYVICAWVQEDLSDAAAEIVASRFITIGPPLPVISKLTLAHTALGRSGTRVRFRLNTPATVRFRVQERRPGRRVGTGCVRPTRALRGNARCARYVAVAGGFSRRGRAGANSFRYRARTSGRRLLAGRYRLLATPRNASGKGNTLRRSFRVLRAR